MIDLMFSEPLFTWLAIQTFNQVVSMFATEAQVCGFDP